MLGNSLSTSKPQKLVSNGKRTRVNFWLGLFEKFYNRNFYSDYIHYVPLVVLLFADQHITIVVLYLANIP